MGMVFYNSFTKYYENITTVSESKREPPCHRLRDGKRAVNNSRKKGFPSEAFWGMNALCGWLAQRQTIREMIQRTRAVKRAAARKAITFW